MKTVITAVALALALPLSVAAQQGQPRHQGPHHGQERGQQQGMMQQGMMQQGLGRAMMREHPGPGMMLRLQESLGLSEAQVERLTAMHEEAHEAMQAHMEQAREARSRAHEVMASDDPDLDAFQAALQEAAGHTVQAQTAMARVHLQAADVLEAGQRETLDTILGAMDEMRPERPRSHAPGEGPGPGPQHRGGAGSAGS